MAGFTAPTLTVPRDDITIQETIYLRDIGLEVVMRNAPKDTRRPYLQLGAEWERRRCPVEHYVQRGCKALDNHPSNTEAGKLTRIVEALIAGGLEWKKRLGSGQPIKIYVTDPAWNEVARRLAEKYPRKELVTSQS